MGRCSFGQLSASSHTKVFGNVSKRTIASCLAFARSPSAFSFGAAPIMAPFLFAGPIVTGAVAGAVDGWAAGAACAAACSS